MLPEGLNSIQKNKPKQLFHKTKELKKAGQLFPICEEKINFIDIYQSILIDE